MMAGASLLRFSGWQRTDPNDYNPRNSVRDVATRTTPDYATQNRLDGVSIEYMVELCNVVGASPWFGMPKTDTSADLYQTAFATIVKQSLSPDLKVYLEYRDVGAGMFSSSFPTVCRSLTMLHQPRAAKEHRFESVDRFLLSVRG